MTSAKFVHDAFLPESPSAGRHSNAPPPTRFSTSGRILSPGPVPVLPSSTANTGNEFIGSSERFRDLRHSIQMVARTDSAVLIRGETGTGKELVARSIHDESLRNNGPYVKVNCAAIPASLLENELFGHERGAFTGAMGTTAGRFQLAHGGTLFLDEIGDLPLELQPKLLRVLQEQEFEKLGGSRTIRVDVRIVAATNQDLRQMVEQRLFRADLFYRLNVFPIELPPLRERSDDIPSLVQHFVHKFASRMRKHIDHIPTDVMEALRRYSWPGNIRELQNHVERAVIVSTGPDLRLPAGALDPASTVSPTPSRARTLADAEREHILATLRESRGVVGGRNGAAALLGLPRTTLICRMRKLGIGSSNPAPSLIPAQS